MATLLKGPGCNMYNVKPFYPSNLGIEIPNVMYQMKNIQSETYAGSDHSKEDCLVARQQLLLNQLEDLQQAVHTLTVKYSVSFDKSSSLSPQITNVPSPLQPGVVVDVVIHADPSSPPLSVFVLYELLKRQIKTASAVFTHSSVTTTVPDKLRDIFRNNVNGERADIQVAFTVIWKQVKNGPVLLVNTGKQSPIFGESNVARYLGRLLNPSYDSSDIVMATVMDEWLDLAEQVVCGNKKEKMAVVRSMNTRLGRNDWLVGSAMSLVDVVMWSVLHQSGLVDDAPAKVKRWLKVCGEDQIFSKTLHLIG